MFRDCFAAHCGLWFGPDSRFLLENRLARRCASSSHELRRLSLPAAQRLAAGDGELAAPDRRAHHQRDLLPARAQPAPRAGRRDPARAPARAATRGGGPVSVWSAGCSSGEEPYSVVMLAREAGFEPGRDLRVYASDISRTMLQKRAPGRLSRGLVPRDRARAAREVLRWRRTVPGASRTTSSATSFSSRAEPVDRSRIALLGAMDVILCRNVIIYFDTEQAARVETLRGEAAAGRPSAARPRRVADPRVERRSSCATCAATWSTASRCPAPRRPTRGTRRRAASRWRATRSEARVMSATARDPRARDRRLGVQPAHDHPHARALAAGRGGRLGARRRGGAAQGARAAARPDHARPRDAAHGWLHLPAHPDEQAADARDRGQRARPETRTSSRRSSSARSTSSPSRRRAPRPSSPRSSRS